MIARTATPSHILMTTDTIGGTWTYAIEMARALAEESVEVHLATMGEMVSPEQQSEAAGVSGLTLHQSRYRLPWMDQPWNDVRCAGGWLQQLCAEVKPDLVHTNEPVYGALRWTVPVLAVVHSCVLSWWESVRGGSAPPEWRRYRHAMSRGLQQAQAVVAPSAWMLRSAQRLYGVSNGRVIANGRDPGAFTPGVKEPIVFAAGRLWDPAKNIQALQSAADALPWPVYVAGNPRHPGKEEEFRRAGALHLLGQLSTASVASWLAKASIYALPARYEPFGLSVLEAALAGCALVLGDIPTLRELWDGSAVFVSPDDPDTLRLAIQGLIEDPSLCHTLSMRARRRALALSPQRMARAYLDQYRELLARFSLETEETACAS